MIQQTFYHSLLRIAALTVAFVLIFESGLLSQSTKELSDGTRLYLAQAIGMHASVTPNEINQLTAELTALKRDLANRDASQSERNIAVELSNDSSTVTISTFLLSSILFILLVLILLNYVFDYVRQSKARNLQQPA